MQSRDVLRWLWAWGLEWSGSNRRARLRLDGSRAAILMYHRVLPEADAVRDAVLPAMYVTPERFERQLEWLTAGFRILPLSEIVERLTSGSPLPCGACALTFDDGWRDNFEYALPALRRFGLSATIFVVTSRVGTPGAFWTDEVHRRLAPLSRSELVDLAERLGAKSSADPVAGLMDRLKAVAEADRPALLDELRGIPQTPTPPGRELLDWAELDTLSDAGIDVESHGATHAILTGLEPAEVERELCESREALRARGHGRHDLLAYPSGAYDEAIWNIARRAGYRAAVSTENALAGPGSELGSLPRLGIHQGISHSRAEFLRKVPGWHPGSRHDARPASGGAAAQPG